MAAITANGSLDHTNLHPPQSPEAYTPPPRKNQDMKYTNGNRLARGSALNMDDMAICASPGSYMPSKLRKRYTSNDQPAESLGGLLRRFAVQHQLGISLNFMLLVAMSYVLFPSLRMRMGAFLWLSYRAEEIEGGIVEGGKAMFGQGPRDLNWVASCVICFTAVRAFMLEYVLAPLAGRLGVEKKKLRMR